MLWADAPKGLGVRLRSSGSASWVYVYRPRGAGRDQPSRTVTLGRESSFTLKQAQAAAAALAGEVALQRDPAAERQAERLRDKSSVAKVSTASRPNWPSAKSRAATIMNTLRRELASLLKREAGTLQRKELVALIDRIQPRAVRERRTTCARTRARCWSSRSRRALRSTTFWPVCAGLGPRAPSASTTVRAGARSTTMRSRPCGLRRKGWTLWRLLRLALAGRISAQRARGLALVGCSR